MLPNKHFGGENIEAEHWLGLVDGIYAICITILSLELPDYISHLDNITNLIGFKGSFVLAFMDFIAYACLFFIIYELWSYHRAIVKTASLNKRWQNLVNVSILLLVTILPAFLLERIQHRIEIIAMLEKSENNLYELRDFLLHHVSGYIPIIFLVFICFFLVGLLIAASKPDKSSELYLEIFPSIRKKYGVFILIGILSLIVSVYRNPVWVYLITYYLLPTW